MSFHWEGDVNEMATLARQAARRALELDPSMHEAHLAVAMLAYAYDHDWPASERAFRKVFEINPNWAYAHRGYALALASRGLFDRAFVALERAQRLDPLSVLSTSEKLVVLLCAQRYDEAIRTAQTQLALAPEPAYPRLAIGIASAGLNRFPEAIVEFQSFARKGGRGPVVLGRLGYALARAGRPEEARALIGEIEAMVPSGDAADVALAMIHSGLGEKTRAIGLLDRAACGSRYRCRLRCRRSILRFAARRARLPASPRQVRVAVAARGESRCASQMGAAAISRRR